jgi:hypothetical protein
VLLLQFGHVLLHQRLLLVQYPQFQHLLPRQHPSLVTLLHRTYLALLATARLLL